MRLTQLDGLVAFVTVAARRSFTAAAAELGVSAPALSQAVRHLEARLAVRLLNRTTRSVAPTEAGQEFLARVAPAVADLFDATQALGRHRTRPTGLLRLNVPRVVASTLLRPLVPAFCAENPDVQVELSMDEGLSDIVAQGFDAGFRLGDYVPKDMVATRFGPPMRAAVVGAPAYFAAKGLPPRTVAALREHDLIRYRAPTSQQLYKWEFVQRGRMVEVESHGRFVCNDSLALIDAALDGMGLAYTFDIAVAEHLRAGRLVRVLESASPRLPPFFIYYPGRRQVPLKLRSFIDFARRHAAA